MEEIKHATGESSLNYSFDVILGVIYGEFDSSVTEIPHRNTR